MIIKADAKTLEWRTYIEWSKDPVGLEEIYNKYDIHSDNQKVFELPERLIAKIFLFRKIYWGPAYAFANDPLFSDVSPSVKFWQNVIDKANEKYKVLYEFQKELVRKANDREIIVSPFGREYLFDPKQGKYGELYFNERDVVNWPNQGLAADVMVVCRLSCFRRLFQFPEFLLGKIKPFATVHDDIELDIDNNPKLCYNICCMLEDVFKDFPANFYKIYKKEWITPMEGEVSFGKNLKNLVKFKRELEEKQFENTSN